ncbi:MAG TPA: TonB-dependent receptor [Lentimicrobium sp.]|nr:TonB-dependent receptor [Lentimicrobium sp.]
MYETSHQSKPQLKSSLRLRTTEKSTNQELNFKTLFPLLLFTLIISYGSFAQKRFAISGYVREKVSRELLPGVNIYVPSLKTGAITNNYGFYSLSLPEGEYEIRYSYVGYNQVIRNVKLSGHQTIDIDLEGTTLEEVVITGNKSERISESERMSVITMPVNQIKNIPALLGEKDVFKALQLMPGVQKGSEGSSGLYVRGGGPDQNLIILDDAPVYNANHLFGFFSIFNGDALKSVELIKGGFPARFGGRLSSVVEMTMKDGNKQKLAGEAGIGLVSSRLLLEGPIVKDKSSFIVSGRRTYIDALIRPLMSSDEKAGYYFYDLNAKANYEFGPANRIYLSGYFGRDKFNVVTRYNGEKDEGGLYWQNSTGTLRWNHLFSPKVFTNTSLIYSAYKLNIYESYHENFGQFSLNYSSGIRDVALKYDVEYHATPYYYLRAGLHLTNHLFTPSAIVLKDESIELYSNKKTRYESFEGGLYVENNITLGEHFKANGGLRLSNFFTKEKGYAALEPRVVMNYRLADDLSLKAGYAEMNQYIHLLSNTGIGLPTDLWVPSTDTVEPQHSKQISFGLARDISKYDLTLTIEGYYKKSEKILGYKPGSSFLALDDPTDAQEFTWEDNVTAGSGKSYGLEFLIHKKTGKLNGWIGYTLSWTKLKFDEINYGKEFWARYDRRHDLSVVAMYEIKKNVNFSATWVYGTGNSITLPLGQYAAVEHDPFETVRPVVDDMPGFIYSTVTDYGDVNSLRMKAYHRLDLAFQFVKQKRNHVRTWEIGLYNAYNRKNPFFYFLEDDYNENITEVTTKLKQVSIFPVIPSVTYSVKF